MLLVWTACSAEDTASSFSYPRNNTAGNFTWDLLTCEFAFENTQLFGPRWDQQIQWTRTTCSGLREWTVATNYCGEMSERHFKTMCLVLEKGKGVRFFRNKRKKKDWLTLNGCFYLLHMYIHLSHHVCMCIDTHTQIYIYGILVFLIRLGCQFR